MEEIEVTTDCFRITPTVYLRYIARSVIFRLLLIIIIPLTGCLIAALWDIRWAFVALIILFLIAPGLITYIYFSRLLTREAQKALSPKYVTFRIDTCENTERWNMTITYVSADEENTPPRPISIDCDSIDKISVTGRQLVLETSRLGYPLIIPTHALGKNSDRIKEILFKKSGDYYCS